MRSTVAMVLAADSSSQTLPFDPGWLDMEAAPEFTPSAAPRLNRDDIRLAVSCLELTSLNAADTPAKLRAMEERAINPLGPDGPASIAAICVYPRLLGSMGTWIRTKGVRVVTVAGAYPHGLADLEARLHDVKVASRMAEEIDVPIPRFLVLERRWQELFHELAAIRQAAGSAILKVILSTAELRSPELIFNAAVVSLTAGADFVKTSTGKDGDVASVAEATAIARALLAFKELTGQERGLKAAGGIQSGIQAMEWVGFAKALYGASVGPNQFRIGASSLLDELNRLAGTET